MRKTRKLERELKSKLAPGPERGGVILRNGAVIEIQNIAEDPSSNCIFDVAGFLPHVDTMAATWHTHPDESAALSGMDWQSFANWPEQLHAIVGNDGLRWYAVAPNGAVVNA